MGLKTLKDLSPNPTKKTPLYRWKCRFASSCPAAGTTHRYTDKPWWKRGGSGDRQKIVEAQGSLRSIARQHGESSCYRTRPHVAGTRNRRL